MFRLRSAGVKAATRTNPGRASTKASPLRKRPLPGSPIFFESRALRPLAAFARLFLFLALLAPLAVPALAQGDAGWLYRGSDIAPDPAWKIGTLDNGLRYAIRRNPLPAGQVAIRIRIDAGALHEEDHERGWAHFVEHMLFRGTESFPDRRGREIWAELGASFGSDSNARTTANETVYQLDLPRAGRSQLDTSLQVLAEMLARARFDPAAVAA